MTKNNTKKGFTGVEILVVVVVIVLLAVGFWWWKNQSSTQDQQPTPASPTTTPSPTKISDDETPSDWEMYEDEDFGFVIKYPKHLTVSRSIPPVGTGGVVSFTVEGEDVCNSDYFHFFVNYNNEGGVFDKQKMISSEPIKVGSIETELLVKEEPENYDCIVRGKANVGDFVHAYTYFESDNNEWSIRSNVKADSLESNLSLFKQILSTFEFVE